MLKKLEPDAAAKARRKPLPHSRGIESNAGSPPTYVERRGIRETRWPLTDAEIAILEHKPLNELSDKLVTAVRLALAVLQVAGIDANSPQTVPQGGGVFQHWHASTTQLTRKYGVHSPVTLADQFLGSLCSLKERLNAAEFFHALAFAEVWRNFQFEISGEHQLAASGVHLGQGPARARAAKKEQSRAQANIVEAAYQAYCQKAAKWPNRLTNAGAAASALAKDVNAALEAAGLPRIKTDTLRRKLAPSVRARKTLSAAA